MLERSIVTLLICSFFACSRSTASQYHSAPPQEATAAGHTADAQHDIYISPLFDRSYPPKLVREQKYISPTEEQKLWALATGALLNEVRQGRHDLLGGRESTPEGIRKEKESLFNWWGIRNREDLLRILESIEQGGHRKSFDELAHYVASLTPAELSAYAEQVSGDNQMSCSLDAVLTNYKHFGSKSIAGWDYARYVMLCRWGYYVGYLSEDEAWEKIMPAARLLQQTFDSWDDLARNYMVGRQFWSYEEITRTLLLFVEAYMKLFIDPTSPWVRIPWDLDLTPPNAKRTETRTN